AAGHLQGEYDATGKLIEETLWLYDTPVAVLKLRNGASDGGPTGGGLATAWQGLPAGGVDVFWIEPDHLDTPRAIVNAAHQLMWQWDSDPFGTTAANETPTPAIGTAFVFNLRFAGQYFDAETGTHYNYFRDYEPGTGRYVESDPVGLAGGSNTFAYVESGPLFYDDAFGLWSPRPDRWGGGRHDNGRRKYTPGGGIYGLFCLGEKIAKYIGKTNDFRRRYHEHNSRGGKLDQCECGNAVFVPLEEINDPVDRDARERKLIKKLKPKLNKLLKGGGCGSCGSGNKRRKYRGIPR
ncbi:MAG: GIY-YIG nuclease family protein, partial [Xanthomonadales bacterium]|nr:GIY-YIG nuclease family protein [Xanthomonadales bacterium]